MNDAVNEYEGLKQRLLAIDGVVASQMFGKACLKFQGKAFVAQHNDAIVFKLTGDAHKKALGQTGAVLWDPSGKGRPMKEWVALPAESNKTFTTLSKAALDYAREKA